MKADKDGGPAFPSQEEDGGGGYVTHRGMTLRDWFAGQALAGIMCSNGRPTGDEAKALWAYEMADAMLAAREKGQA